MYDSEVILWLFRCLFQMLLLLLLLVAFTLVSMFTTPHNVPNGGFHVWNLYSLDAYLRWKLPLRVARFLNSFIEHRNRYHKEPTKSNDVVIKHNPPSGRGNECVVAKCKYHIDIDLYCYSDLNGNINIMVTSVWMEYVRINSNTELYLNFDVCD